MKLRLKKWKCPTCELEWFQLAGESYFTCPSCGKLCNRVPDEWHVGDGVIL